MAIITQIKQYGFKNSFARGIKLVLRLCNVHIETYIYYSQKINLVLMPNIDFKSHYVIQKLDYNNYKYSKGLMFDDFKLGIFKKRLESNTYEAYGVFDKELLIYSTWISTKQLEVSVNKFGLELGSDEGLLLDIITHQEYRRQGLHNFMNLYCLKRIKQLGKSNAAVLVLKENIPARKSQERSGFIKTKKIIHYKIFGLERIKILNYS